MNKQNDYKFLASPYTDPDPAVMRQRYEEALCATAWLLQERVWIFSPIVHCHIVAGVYGLPTDAAYWQEYNNVMIANSGGIIVLDIPGWHTSAGVLGEIRLALFLDIPIEMLKQDADNYWIEEYSK